MTIHEDLSSQEPSPFDQMVGLEKPEVLDGLTECIKALDVDRSETNANLALAQVRVKFETILFGSGIVPSDLDEEAAEETTRTAWRSFIQDFGGEENQAKRDATISELNQSASRIRQDRINRHIRGE